MLCNSTFVIMLNITSLCHGSSIRDVRTEREGVTPNADKGRVGSAYCRRPHESDETSYRQTGTGRSHGRLV